VPSELSQLTNLTNLDLSFNKLESVPSELSQLTNLTNLYLSFKFVNCVTIDEFNKFGFIF